MTYANFKDQVLALMNRDATPFTSTGAQDLVLAAMNDARRDAQRKYAFNLNRQPVFADLSLIGKSLLTDFTVTPGGAAVVVKQVDAVYEYASTTVGATVAYYRTNKVVLLRHSAFQAELNYSAMTLARTQPPYNTGSLRTPMSFVYLQGTSLYHSTLQTTQNFFCDAIVMLPNHPGDTSQDVFLTYFVDWLKYATVMKLNLLLKDAERFQIDESVMEDMWNSVKQFDAQQAVQGAIDLD